MVRRGKLYENIARIPFSEFFETIRYDKNENYIFDSKVEPNFCRYGANAKSGPVAFTRSANNYELRFKRSFDSIKQRCMQRYTTDPRLISKEIMAKIKPPLSIREK